MKISIPHISQLPTIAQQILDFAADKKIFLFEGDLGAGKTTIIKELCNILQVKDIVCSPTYGFVNEYEGTQKIYHMDLYRLNYIEEAFDIGIEDYLDSEAICFIEWYQIVEEILPRDCVYVSIEKISEDERMLTLK